jgi:hypothetical protein
MYDYLSRIVAVLVTEKQPDPEERSLMLSNVWGEISGGMMDLALDKESSPLLETLISHSDLKHLSNFVSILTRERRGSYAFVDLLLNVFGSFVNGKKRTNTKIVLTWVRFVFVEGITVDQRKTKLERHVHFVL